MNFLVIISGLLFLIIGALCIWRKDKVWMVLKKNAEFMGMKNISNYVESPVYGKGKKEEVNWIGRLGVYLFIVGVLLLALMFWS